MAILGPYQGEMFRTELPLTPHPQQLPHSARVLTIGSCFSDSIGNRLTDFKVATLVNPFGTVFNPISACKLLRAAAGEDIDWQQHVVEARGRWQSYDLHATLGADSPVELLQHIQRLVRDTGVFLATADAVVLTLGTAFAYRLQDTQEIISNCHKVPAEKFEKELLSADEIIAAIAETHAYLRRINPRLRFILTVSPVRHLKETLPLSSVSKSMLRVACHYLSELLPDVSYFPAYELLMDDLRDYRFYAADMLHPSEVAENYIWERFTRTYFDTAFGRFKKEWESLRQALNHRPLHSAAPEHRQFLEATLVRLQRLSAQTDVRMELLHVEKELAALPLPPPPPLPEPDEEEEEEFLDEELVPSYTKNEAPARLLSQGSGLLVESDEPEEDDSDETNPEEAYESAYSGEALEYAQDDDMATEDAGEAVADEEAPVRKKKRRSRGGAKRSKRKAARLAAETEATGIAPETDAISHSAPSVGHFVASTAPLATAEPEENVPAEGITYISEAELFGAASRNRPTEPVTSASQAEPSSVSLTTSVADDTTGLTPDAAQPEPRRRNRPERQPRPPGNREPSKANRPPLYAVAATKEDVPTSAEDQPAALMPAEPQANAGTTQAPTAAPITPSPTKSRSRSRGGAGRNRSTAGKDRVAQAAESAAAVSPVTAAPAPEVKPVETPLAPETAASEPTATPTRPKRAPRKPTTPKPAPEVIAPAPAAGVAAIASEVEKAAPAKKRPARKAVPVAQPEAAVAATSATPAVAPKKASSRKKAVPAASAAEPSAPDAPKAPAPKRARPPRRKPAADAGSEGTE